MKFSWLVPALLTAMAAVAHADGRTDGKQDDHAAATPAAYQQPVLVNGDNQPALVPPDAPTVERRLQLHPPLLVVEAEAGAGMSVGAGSTGPTVLRASPITLSLMLDYALRYKPWMSVYGGMRAETWQRAGVGGLIGLRIRPMRNGFRIGTAFVDILWPYSISGFAGHMGYCPRFGKQFHICADAEMTAFVFGGDVPKGRVVLQPQLMIGAAFDAL